MPGLAAGRPGPASARQRWQVPATRDLAARVAELPLSSTCAAIAWHRRPLDPGQPRP
jgi:hypothetical protein